MGLAGSDLVRCLIVLGARPAGRQSTEAVPGQWAPPLAGPAAADCPADGSPSAPGCLLPLRTAAAGRGLGADRELRLVFSRF